MKKSAWFNRQSQTTNEDDIYYQETGKAWSNTHDIEITGKEDKSIVPQSIDDLQEGWRVPLTTGNYGLYEEGAKWEGDLSIWDLDMGTYLPIEMIDWEKIKQDPKSIIKEKFASLKVKAADIPPKPTDVPPQGQKYVYNTSTMSWELVSETEPSAEVKTQAAIEEKAQPYRPDFEENIEGVKRVKPNTAAWNNAVINLTNFLWDDWKSEGNLAIDTLMESIADYEVDDKINFGDDIDKMVEVVKKRLEGKGLEVLGSINKQAFGPVGPITPDTSMDAHTGGDYEDQKRFNQNVDLYDRALEKGASEGKIEVGDSVEILETGEDGTVLAIEPSDDPEVDGIALVEVIRGRMSIEEEWAEGDLKKIEASLNKQAKGKLIWNEEVQGIDVAVYKEGKEFTAWVEGQESYGLISEGDDSSTLKEVIRNGKNEARSIARKTNKMFGVASFREAQKSCPKCGKDKWAWKTVPEGDMFLCTSCGYEKLKKDDPRFRDLPQTGTSLNSSKQIKVGVRKDEGDSKNDPDHNSKHDSSVKKADYPSHYEDTYKNLIDRAYEIDGGDEFSASREDKEVMASDDQSTPDLALNSRTSDNNPAQEFSSTTDDTHDLDALGAEQSGRYRMVSDEDMDRMKHRMSPEDFQELERLRELEARTDDKLMEASQYDVTKTREPQYAQSEMNRMKSQLDKITEEIYNIIDKYSNEAWFKELTASAKSGFFKVAQSLFKYDWDLGKGVWEIKGKGKKKKIIKNDSALEKESQESMEDNYKEGSRVALLGTIVPGKGVIRECLGKGKYRVMNELDGKTYELEASQLSSEVDIFI